MPAVSGTREEEDELVEDEEESYRKDSQEGSRGAFLRLVFSWEGQISEAALSPSGTAEATDEYSKSILKNERDR